MKVYKAPNCYIKAHKGAFLFFWHYAHLLQICFLLKAPFYSNLIKQHLASVGCLVTLKQFFTEAETLALQLPNGAGELLCPHEPTTAARTAETPNFNRSSATLPPREADASSNKPSKIMH